ncbi:MAG: RDD family protein, partial [Thiothrix litoralis]
PISTPARGYFASQLGGFPSAKVGMRLLALAFDWLLVGLLLVLVLLLVFGQAWLLYHVSYTDSALYLVVVTVPLAYFGGFWGLLGATPGKLLLLPWLE